MVEMGHDGIVFPSEIFRAVESQVGSFIDEQDLTLRQFGDEAPKKTFSADVLQALGE